MSPSDPATGSVGTEPRFPPALGQVQGSSSDPGAVLGSASLAKDLGSKPGVTGTGNHREASLPWFWG